jgi:hypothetical protein
MFKIADQKQSLCSSCRWGLVLVTDLGRQQTRCGCFEAGHKLIEVHVVKCSQYDDKAAPQMYQLEEIAWKVKTDKQGQSIGFVPPVPK